MCTGSSAESWAEKRKGPGGYPVLLPLFRGWNRFDVAVTTPCSICVLPPLTPSIACAESAMACSTLRSGRYPFTIVSRASSAAWPIANAEPLNVVPRSEEHTSELQSLAYLVCRLLLEKKNTQDRY